MINQASGPGDLAEWSKALVPNVRPAGQIRPATTLSPARGQSPVTDPHFRYTVTLLKAS